MRIASWSIGVLLASQNIPFLVALGCCLVLALMQIVAGFGDHDADADADGAPDHDVDIDHDIDSDIDHDIDHDVDHDTAHPDAHPQLEVGHAGGAGGALSALGIGRVPLMLVMMSFLGSFGAVGLIANSLVSLGGSYPAWGLLVVLVASVLVALPLTGGLSRTFGRFASRSTTAVTFEQLVGRVGTVVTPSVSATYGRVTVRDAHGSLHTVYAVVEAGEALPERSEVALVRYDPAERHFVVVPLNGIQRRQGARKGSRRK
jgi:membrane protein implicated in regulation of membrane protease activity